VAGYDPFGDDHTARDTWRRALRIYARAFRLSNPAEDHPLWEYERGHWAGILADLRDARGDSRRWSVVARRVWNP
jgi:hypothetical protein